MLSLIKKGDLISCDVLSFTNNRNPDGTHPCLVLEVLKEGLKVAVVTHNSSINDKDCYTVDLITCCMTLTGFIKIIKTDLHTSLCKYDNICNCYVTPALKLILKKYNIDFYEDEK